METFNGWKNYATWATALWIDNEEGTQKYFASRAAELRDECSDFIDAQCSLAQELRDFTEDNVPELEASLYSDLMGWALEQIDFYEIAKSIIEE